MLESYILDDLVLDEISHELRQVLPDIIHGLFQVFLAVLHQMVIQAKFEGLLQGVFLDEEQEIVFVLWVQ